MGPGECGPPSGIRWAHSDESDVVYPGAAIGTLIAWVDGGPTVAIGTARTFVSSNQGYLELAFNDRASYYNDNSGSVTAQVRVSRPVAYRGTPSAVSAALAAEPARNWEGSL
jgi:hypothetical protein